MASKNPAAKKTPAKAAPAKNTAANAKPAKTSTVADKAKTQAQANQQAKATQNALNPKQRAEWERLRKADPAKAKAYRDKIIGGKGATATTANTTPTGITTSEADATGTYQINKDVTGVTAGVPIDGSKFDVTADDIELDPYNFTDTSFNYDQVSADQVAAGTVTADQLAGVSMEGAEYTIVDPSKIATEYGDIGRQQMRQNAALSSELALQALDTELQGLQSYAPAAAALSRGQTALDNQFNQEQLDAQLAATDPNIRADLMSQRDRALALASGRMPSSIEDRAYELGIRSSAADVGNSGGFGASSGAGRKASDLMSASQRLQLSQYGDQLLNTNIDTRRNQLFAKLQESTAGSQINVMPTQSGAQLALSIAGQANQSLLLSPDAALNSLAQQSQFATSEENQTRRFNTTLEAERGLNQANLNMQANTTNVSNNLNAALANQSSNLRAKEVNAANAIQTQSVGMDIRSRENLANQEMQFNVQNSNANRRFDALNANAGRAFQAATFNSEQQYQAAVTNATFINQDKQAKLARKSQTQLVKYQEQQANIRARISASASVQAAGISAAATRYGIDANIQAQKEQNQFMLDQQTKATEEFKKEADKRRDDKTTADIISRAPTIIAGVRPIIDAIGNIFGSDDNDLTSDEFFSNTAQENADWNKDAMIAY